MLPVLCDYNNNNVNNFKPFNSFLNLPEEYSNKSNFFYITVCACVQFFSDNTAEHSLNAASRQCEGEVTHIHHLGLDKDEPLSPTHTDPFLIHSSIGSHSPGIDQEPGTGGSCWVGPESQCPCQNLSDEQPQFKSYAGNTHSLTLLLVQGLMH